MDSEIIWSDEAIFDLGEICSYIAKDNPQAAERVGKSILEQVGILASFPQIGVPYSRESQGELREIKYRPYRIFYEVFEDSHLVAILHLWHSARDEPEF